MAKKGIYQPFTVITFDEPMKEVEYKALVPASFAKEYKQRLLYYSDIIAMELGL